MGSEVTADRIEHPRLTRWRRKLIREATALCGDVSDAEDLVQEVFERALEQDDFDELEYPLAWLRKTLRNLYIDGYRRRKTRRRVLKKNARTVESQIGTRRLEGGADESKLTEALSELPSAMAQALLLVVVEQYTYAEAADVQDVAEGTVKSRVARARKRLAELLTQNESTSHAGGDDDS